MNKLFTVENKVPRTRFVARKVAGPKVKNYEWSVCLKTRKFVYAHKNKSVTVDLSLLIKMQSCC